MGRRATMNNRRIQGARHNDRQFKNDLEGAKHINWEKTKDNEYQHFYTDENNPDNPDNKLTFEEAEQRFYSEYFSESLSAKNERYKKEGHKDRMQTMEQYRKNKRTCPEETLFYVGDKNNDVDPQILKQIYADYYSWHDDKFGNSIVILNAALHLDEATPHIHERRVYVSKDKDGNLVVNQNKALADLGIKAPASDKKTDRYNNPKITYTKMCRQKLQELCIEHGYDLILEPKGKGGLELEEYRRKELKMENQIIEKQIQSLISQIGVLEANKQSLIKVVQNLKSEINAKNVERDLILSEIDKLNKDIKALMVEKEKRAEEQIDLEPRITAKLAELNTVKEKYLKTGKDAYMALNGALDVIWKKAFNVKNIESPEALEKINKYIKFFTRLAHDKSDSDMDYQRFKTVFTNLMKSIEEQQLFERQEEQEQKQQELGPYLSR